MATRKGKRKAKPARKAAAARKPAPKSAAKKAAPKKAPAKAAPKIAAPKLPPKWSAAQKSEFAAIQACAKTLSAGLKRTDFDNDGNPLSGGLWTSMLADLDAWARKHGVTLKTDEHDHGAGAEATPLAFRGECPGSFTKVEKRKFADFTQVHTTSCTLRRQTWLGRCLYDCVDEYDYV